VPRRSGRRNVTAASEAERDLFARAVEALDDRSVGAALTGKGDAAAEGGSAHPGARPPSRAARTTRAPARERETTRPPTIDLHGCDRITALDRLARFVAGLPRGAEALVVHGRGERILAAAVAAFLDRDARVLEYHEAPRRWGGGGARLVRMR
jgi:hypothetical protein